jgi:hypothetical protein
MLAFTDGTCVYIMLLPLGFIFAEWVIADIVVVPFVLPVVVVSSSVDVLVILIDEAEVLDKKPEEYGRKTFSLLFSSKHVDIKFSAHDALPE